MLRSCLRKIRGEVGNISQRLTVCHSTSGFHAVWLGDDADSAADSANTFRDSAHPLPETIALFLHLPLVSQGRRTCAEKKAIKLMQYECQKVVDISRAEQFSTRGKKGGEGLHKTSRSHPDLLCF